MGIYPAVKLPQVALDWSWSEGSSITIMSNIATTLNALGEQQYSMTQSYNGPANIYDQGGTIMDDILGAVAAEILKVIITPTPTTSLPAVSVGDEVTVNSSPNAYRYLVQHAHYWDTYPYSLELSCNLAKG